MSEFADRILLAPDPTAASRVREFIKDRLRTWEAATPPDPAVEDAVLLGSELVANAVQHAGTGVEVGCRVVEGVVEVAVTDRHPARAVPDPRGIKEDPYSERGRALTLSAALASSWGETYTGAAKTVWFQVRLSPPRSAPVPRSALSLDPDIEPSLPLSFAQGRELGKLDFGGLVRHRPPRRSRCRWCPPVTRCRCCYGPRGNANCRVPWPSRAAARRAG